MIQADVIWDNPKRTVTSKITMTQADVIWDNPKRTVTKQIIMVLAANTKVKVKVTKLDG